MGIKNASTLKKKFHLADSVLESSELAELYKDNAIYVDVFGAFYWKIRKSLYQGDVEKLAKFFQSTFPLPNTTFVFDGARSDQKKGTHTRRDESREIRLRKLEGCINQISARLVAKKRVSKALWKKAEDLLEKNYVAPQSSISKLVECMEKLNLTVAVAEGEADVFIATKNNCDLVITNDSDLLFYPNIGAVATVQRSFVLPTFTVIKRNVVLQRLKLSSGKFPVYY